MRYTITTIENFITSIRESFDESIEVYTNGSCIRFALILDSVFPGGKILYDYNHAIWEYDGVCYDINGQVKKTLNHFDIKELPYYKLNELFKLKHK